MAVRKMGTTLLSPKTPADSSGMRPRFYQFSNSSAGIVFLIIGLRTHTCTPYPVL